MSYIGRFAPTPSGPLHLGSLLTALASYLQAKSHDGQWLLRIDDLDRPRCVPGMDAEILRQLEAHGLLWDAQPRYQTQHTDQYAAALAQLRGRSFVYPCSCTRAQLATQSLQGLDGPVYAGTCRHAMGIGTPTALRLRVPEGSLSFIDGWQGLQRRQLESEVGDFVIRRADGMFAYQLACAIDETAQCITEVARGADLLGSTFRQIFLLQQLGLRQPFYRHLPVLVDTQGRKLSKQNHAEAIDAARAPQNLLRCLRWLRQEPPPELGGADVRTVLDWSVRHWSPERVPMQQSLVVE